MGPSAAAINHQPLVSSQKRSSFKSAAKTVKPIMIDCLMVRTPDCARIHVMSSCMSLCMSLCMSFGMSFSDLGMSLDMSFGMSFGMSFSAAGVFPIMCFLFGKRDVFRHAFSGTRFCQKTHGTMFLIFWNTFTRFLQWSTKYPHTCPHVVLRSKDAHDKLHVSFI